MRKAIGYIRVSTDKQAESGLSLEYQKAKIEAYCSCFDITLAEIIRDDGESAKSLNRPGIKKVIEQVKKGEVETLVILKLDRLTRSVKDLGFITELINKNNTALVAVQENINTSTAAGKLVLNVLGSVAQWEREAIAERTKAALSVKKAQGKRVGSIPYGYKLANDGETLVEVKEEQKVLILIAELRKQGESYRAIAKELETRNILTKKGKAIWGSKTIQQIVKSFQLETKLVA